MVRTAQRVEDLVSEDPAMADALEVVLDRSEDGTVAWADVSDSLTSGQWGRLIEKGLLEDDGGEGFRVTDPDAVREGLESDVESPEIDEDSSWSKYDKLAALGAVGLFAGYSVASVRNAIGRTIDIFLGPVDAMLPFYAVVLVLALFTGLYSTILQSNLMDMEKMGKYQEQMKEIQQRRKDAQERGDDDELEKIQEEQMEAMGDQMGMFKEQFRPMVWIMLLTIPVFLWMYWMILTRTPTPESFTMPLVGTVTWTEGVLGPLQAWILWYFVCSMGFTQIIRKALHIQTTPST
ncbi:DUF106 domain-containing protein [Natronomonas sp. EA1]|uniref:DUF106 domain-containing protein n=1 Tax=Natronomonas sp. EA1 TaxID=3421655 RepID=UPI003EC13D2E